MTETDEERINKMVDEVNALQKSGKNKEALGLLDKVFKELRAMFGPTLISATQQFLAGRMWHYRGRVLQAMNQYDEAIDALNTAINLRKNDAVSRAYSVFQKFICKQYGEFPISDEEVEETKLALSIAWANKAATIADIGNMMQNLAYVEQTKGDTEKAILFYEMTLKSRETAGDARGYALTQARLAEIYWEMKGMGPLAIRHGKSALEYFEKTNDVERIKQVKAVFGWE